MIIDNPKFFIVLVISIVVVLTLIVFGFRTGFYIPEGGLKSNPNPAPTKLNAPLIEVPFID